jgi:hypothetical protein
MEARAKIELLSLNAQTEVIANGLESEASRLFFDKMPSLETLMPQIDVTEIKRLTDRRHSQQE